jgi:hypothetical protein
MTRIGLACLVLTLCANAQQPPWPDPAFPFGAVYFRVVFHGPPFFPEFRGF